MEPVFKLIFDNDFPGVGRGERAGDRSRHAMIEKLDLIVDGGRRCPAAINPARREMRFPPAARRRAHKPAPANKPTPCERPSSNCRTTIAYAKLVKLFPRSTDCQSAQAKKWEQNRTGLKVDSPAR